MMRFKATRMYLQKHVLGKKYAMADLMFGRINQCTKMIECKLPEWMNRMDKKMSYMKKKMFILKGGLKAILKNLYDGESKLHSHLVD